MLGSWGAVVVAAASVVDDCWGIGKNPWIADVISGGKKSSAGFAVVASVELAVSGAAVDELGTNKLIMSVMDGGKKLLPSCWVPLDGRLWLSEVLGGSGLGCLFSILDL